MENIAVTDQLNLIKAQHLEDLSFKLVFREDILLLKKSGTLLKKSGTLLRCDHKSNKSINALSKEAYLIYLAILQLPWSEIRNECFNLDDDDYNKLIKLSGIKSNLPDNEIPDEFLVEVLLELHVNNLVLIYLDPELI